LLRKLFIGLLILSALTAKGTGSGISDLAERFSPESFLSLCGENWLSDAEAADIREIKLSKGIPVFRGDALVSLGEFLRVKSLEQHIYCNIGDNSNSKGYEPFLYCTKPVLNSNIRNLVSCGTDISPPAL
jgi:hypothetical protein